MIRTRLQGGTPFFPNMLNNGKVEVCLKEDVDKALIEKDKEIIHHKFKRCLAMARMCEERSARYDVLQERHDLDWGREIEFYYRWYKRWMELADKFKEAK